MITAYHKDIKDWQEFPDYDLLYCDPPWEERMSKFFDTMNLKQNGKITVTNHEGIMKHLAALANTKKPMVIEYSIKGSDKIISIMIGAGHHHTGSYYATQTSGRPHILLAFNADIPLSSNLKGDECITATLDIVKPKTVFDPFAGIGFTAAAVSKWGADYIGSEYNYARYLRLKKTAEKYD